MTVGTSCHLLHKQRRTVSHLPGNYIRFYREQQHTGIQDAEIPVSPKLPAGKIQAKPLPKEKMQAAPGKRTEFSVPFEFRTPNSELLKSVNGFAEFAYYIRTGSIYSITYHMKRGDFALLMKDLGHKEAEKHLSEISAHYTEVWDMAKTMTDRPEEFLRQRLIGIIDPLLTKQDWQWLSFKMAFGDGPAVIHDPHTAPPPPKEACPPWDLEKVQKEIHDTMARGRAKDMESMRKKI